MELWTTRPVNRRKLVSPNASGIELVNKSGAAARYCLEVQTVHSGKNMSQGGGGYRVRVLAVDEPLGLGGAVETEEEV
jgi:hypothetical protein